MAPCRWLLFPPRQYKNVFLLLKHGRKVPSRRGCVRLQAADSEFPLNITRRCNRINQQGIFCHQTGSHPILLKKERIDSDQPLLRNRNMGLTRGIRLHQSFSPGFRDSPSGIAKETVPEDTATQRAHPGEGWRKFPRCRAVEVDIQHLSRRPINGMGRNGAEGCKGGKHGKGIEQISCDFHGSWSITRVQVFRYRFSTKDIKFSFGLMAAYQGLYGSDSANPYCQIPALRAVGSSKVNWPDIKSWPLALRVCAVAKVRTT